MSETTPPPLLKVPGLPDEGITQETELGRSTRTPPPRWEDVGRGALYQFLNMKNVAGNALDSSVGFFWNLVNQASRLKIDPFVPGGNVRIEDPVRDWWQPGTGAEIIARNAADIRQRLGLETPPDLNQQVDKALAWFAKDHPIARNIGEAMKVGGSVAGFIAGTGGLAANAVTGLVEKAAMKWNQNMALRWGGQPSEYLSEAFIRKLGTAVGLGAVAAADPTPGKDAEHRITEAAWMGLFGWIMPRWLQLGTRVEMGMKDATGKIGSKGAAAVLEGAGMTGEMHLYEAAAEFLGMTPQDAMAIDDFLYAYSQGDEAGVKKHGERLIGDFERFVAEAGGFAAGGGRLYRPSAWLPPSQRLAELRRQPLAEGEPPVPPKAAEAIEALGYMPKGAEQVSGRPNEFFHKGDFYRWRGGKLEMREGGKGKWKPAELPEVMEPQQLEGFQKVAFDALFAADFGTPELTRQVQRGLQTLRSMSPEARPQLQEARAFLELLPTMGDVPMKDVGEAFVRVMSGRQNAEAALGDVMPLAISRGDRPVESTESPETQAIREFGERAFGESPEDPGGRGRWSKFYEAVFNKMEPLEHKMREVEKDLPGAEVRPTADPRKVAAALVGSEQGIADVFMRKGAITFAGEKVGPSWKDIIKSIPKEDVQTVFSYAAARRAVDLEAQGRKSGLDVEGAKKAVEAGEKLPEIKGHAEEVARFFDNVLNYLAESGAYSKQEIADIKSQNPFYLPFFRALSEGQAMGVSTKRGRPLKKLKGKTTIPLQDVQKSAQQYVEMLVRAANKQRLLQSMALFHDRVSKVNPDIADAIMERIKPPVEPTRVTTEEIGRHLEIGKEDMKGVEDLLVFRPQRGESPDVIQIRVDGEKRWYRLDPEVKKLFETPVPPGTGVRTLLAFNDFALRMIRGGAVTISVPFSVANAFRDAIVSAIQGKHISKIPGMAGTKGGLSEVSQIKGLGINALVKKLGIQEKIQDYVDISQRYEAGGAAFSSLSEFFAQSGRTAGKEQTFIDKIAHAIGITERAARRDEFVQAWRGAKERGLSDSDAMIEATYAAKDLIVNYSRKGSASAAIGRYYLFMTPRLGGQDKLVRTFRDKGVLSTMALGMAYVTVPELLSYLLHGDEDWWLDKSSERQNYILFKIPGMDSLVRLPKAFDWGRLFGTLPMEAWISQREDMPERVKRGMTQQAWDMVLGMSPVDSFYPTALRPVAEVHANEHFFSGHPIYPSWMEEKLADYRKFTSGTTEAAKTIAEKSQWLSMKVFQDATADGISPAVLDHLINGYSGGIWWRTVSTVEDILGVKIQDQPTAKRVPVLSRFVTEPWTGSRGLQVFYEQLRAHEAMATALKMDEKDVPDKLLDALFELRIYAKEMKQLRDEREDGSLTKVDANQKIVQKAWEALGRLDELDAATTRGR